MADGGWRRASRQELPGVAGAGLGPVPGAEAGGWAPVVPPGAAGVGASARLQADSISAATAAAAVAASRQRRG
jgi:hypothetical protein